MGRNDAPLRPGHSRDAPRTESSGAGTERSSRISSRTAAVRASAGVVTQPTVRVGTAVGQLARLMGAGQLVGSTGSAAKVRHLTERLGFDRAFDHHEGPVGEQLRKAVPDGLDVYFDNVGGDHLAGAVEVLRDGGRIARCGAVAQYDDAANPPAAPYNLYDVVGKSLRLEGFLVRNHRHVQGELEEHLTPYLRSGELVPGHTVTVGLDRSADAFLGMLAGENVGKAIAQVAEEPDGPATGW